MLTIRRVCEAWEVHGHRLGATHDGVKTRDDGILIWNRR